jgi:F420-non-reducing hydrogenase iron-sulfur subunit
VGNYDAIVASHLTRKVIEAAGVRPERLALEWASAAEASLYVELITKFTNQMKELGPLGEAEGISREELKLKLSAAKSAVQSVKLRTRFAKLTLDVRDEGEHIPEVVEAKMAEKINEMIIGEIGKQEKKMAESAVQGAQ